MDIRRRELLALSGMALASATLAPSTTWGQTPKRGGTLSLRTWDPPHFDPFQTISYKTHIALSFTHSRLLRHRAGPGVVPGTFPIEGDLAEAWSQPNDTTYVFKLRRGVRWHNKPPVNGREVTAEDVVFSVNYFMTVKGNANAYMLRSLDKVEAPDRYTVKFTLKEPFVWFLDMLSNPHAVAIVAREVLDKFGDYKKPEAVVGTGPWMLETYRPNVGLTFVRNPNYFVAGLPYIDRIETTVDEDNASRIAAFLSGKYDLGWEFPATINRTDWVQIKDTLKQKRPRLQTLEFPAPVMSHVSMRTDQKPFSDIRVRYAMSLAIDRQAIIDSVFEGVGAMNPPVPAALREWSVPFDKLGEGAKYYAHDPAEAKRLLAAAGYPNGFPATMCFTTYGSTVLVDSMQLVQKDLKAVGIDAKIDQKEYGAYIATCFYGKFDS
ncbi:MAG TPA: ABC transporter substrate-binding protein, partial [Candidatus Bathyarchaeia archaeon]|nr:ABC transporter substrate-binding protein [Candidatus Bathyarchaeia archaeon]